MICDADICAYHYCFNNITSTLYNVTIEVFLMCKGLVQNSASGIEAIVLCTNIL